MISLEGEAQTAVVEEDPGGAGDEMRTEVERVGLGQGDAEAVGIDGTQMRGIPVAEARDGGGGLIRWAGPSGVGPSRLFVA